MLAKHALLPTELNSLRQFAILRERARHGQQIRELCAFAVLGKASMAWLRHAQQSAILRERASGSRSEAEGKARIANCL